MPWNLQIIVSDIEIAFLDPAFVWRRFSTFDLICAFFHQKYSLRIRQGCRREGILVLSYKTQYELQTHPFLEILKYEGSPHTLSSIARKTYVCTGRLTDRFGTTSKEGILCTSFIGIWPKGYTVGHKQRWGPALSSSYAAQHHKRALLPVVGGRYWVILLPLPSPF